jgi:predicted Zn-dependent peptidase
MSIEEIEQQVDAVDFEAIIGLARELFVPERLGLCVLGPLDEAAVRLQRDAA